MKRTHRHPGTLTDTHARMHDLNDKHYDLQVSVQDVKWTYVCWTDSRVRLSKTMPFSSMPSGNSSMMLESNSKYSRAGDSTLQQIVKRIIPQSNVKRLVTDSTISD